VGAEESVDDYRSVYKATDGCRDCSLRYGSARHLRDLSACSSLHEIRFSEADIVDWPILR